MIRSTAVLLTFLAVVTASAQRPLFDPDDFLDPRDTGRRAVFISRAVVGVASNLSGDGFRPLGENVGYVHLANSFSWKSLQFDYKRSQLKAEDGEAAVWERDPRQQRYRQVRNATPSSRDTLQAAWYWPIPAGGGVPVMLRTRVTFATQPIETELVQDVDTDPVPSCEVPVSPSYCPAGFVEGRERVSGRERTFALETDTWFRIARRDVFGSLAISETRTKTNADTLGDRKELAIAYTSRLPSIPVHKARILIRPTLTVGGISNRGGPAVNLVSPAIEIFRPFTRTGANLHLIYSPQWAVDGERWRTTHQLALVFDYPLIVKLF